MEKTYCFLCMELHNDDGKCDKCGSVNDNFKTEPHFLVPGTILNNRYLVGKAIGEGGFGITYIGRDLSLDIKVAIKEFYPSGYVNRSNTISLDVNCSQSEERREFFEKGRERFLKEARALAKFSNKPGIVNVRDFFEDNNTAYIVMEYVEGVTLKQYLGNVGKIPAKKALELLMPAIKSLRKIHANNLIHRDISPDNIMISGDEVTLIDFGAAKNMSLNGTVSMSVMLKPGYAPEEQYRSKGKQGPWTDIYALCATLYKCITGITPDDATERLYSDDIKSPSELGAEIDEKTECAIMKGLSVFARDRYQNIDEFIAGLDGKNIIADQEEKTMFVATATGVAEENTHVLLNSNVGISQDDILTEYKNSEEMLDVVAEDISNKQSVEEVGKPANPATEDDVLTEYRDSSEIARIVSDDKGGMPTVSEEKVEDKKSRKWLILIIVLLLLISIGILTFVFTNGGNSDKNQSGVNSAGDSQVIDDSEINSSPDTSVSVQESEVSSTDTSASESNIETSVVETDKNELQVEMIDCSGLLADQAKKKITSSGLKCKIKEEYSNSVKAGYVISQSVKEGEFVKKGSTVQLVVSKGEKPSETTTTTTKAPETTTTTTTTKVPVTEAPAVVMTVYFDYVGGTNVQSSKLVTQGEIYGDLPTASTKTGYTFNGWTDVNGNSVTASTKVTETGTHTLYAKWTENAYSEWTTTLPSNVNDTDYYIDTATQYRYRDKEFTESSSSSLSGWTQYSSASSWGEYGPWSSWSTTSATENDTRDVEERVVTDKEGYNEYRYLRYRLSGGTRVHWCASCGKKYFGGTWYAQYTDWSINRKTQLNDNNYGRCSHTNYEYVSRYGTENSPYYFEESRWIAPVTHTEYRYRDRSKVYTYYYYKWSEWSEWSSGSVSASDNKDVESRTIYRYKKK